MAIHTAIMAVGRAALCRPPRDLAAMACFFYCNSESDWTIFDSTGTECHASLEMLYRTTTKLSFLQSVAGSGAVVMAGSLLESGAVCLPCAVSPPGTSQPENQICLGNPAQAVRKVGCCCGCVLPPPYFAKITNLVSATLLLRTLVMIAPCSGISRGVTLEPKMISLEQGFKAIVQSTSQPERGVLGWLSPVDGGSQSALLMVARKLGVVAAGGICWRAGCAGDDRLGAIDACIAAGCPGVHMPCGNLHCDRHVHAGCTACERHRSR